MTLQEEIDTPVLFDIPDNARLLPSRAQLKGVAEAGYAVDPPLDLPDVDEGDLGRDWYMGFTRCCPCQAYQKNKG